MKRFFASLRFLVPGAALALAFFGAGCAPDAAPDPNPREFSTGHAPPGAIAVSVNAESFTLPISRVEQGRTAFVVTNTGTNHHDFVLVRRDGDRYGMPIVHYHLAPGEERGVEVTLSPGSYEIACLTVAMERGKAASNMSMGMHASLEVAP